MISPTAHDEFEKDDFRVDDDKEVEGDKEDRKSYDDRYLHLFRLRIDVNVFLHHIFSYV
jgi:hypothetical protein